MATIETTSGIQDDADVAAYRALSPIKRVETWYERTRHWTVGTSMRLLGEALHDYAIEQQERANAADD